MSSEPDEAARRARRMAWVVALLYLALALALAPAYGPVWDCVMGEYPHGEAALSALRSDASYHDLCMGDTLVRPRQPHPFFDPGVRLPWNGTYPLTGIASALSCELLWTRANLLPPLVAHDLPVQLLVALLLWVMVRATGERFGLLAGVASAVLLLGVPNFFAHSFNNLKDAPEAVFYNLAVFALFLALVRGGLWRWLLAGVPIGLALAQRPNALFVPVQMLLFLIGASLLRARSRSAPLRWSWTGLGVAFAVFLAVYWLGSPAFWSDPLAKPLEQLLYHLRFNAHFNDRSEVTVPLDAFLPGFNSGGLVAFLGTTPPAILVLALFGLTDPRLRGEERLFLALGVLVPVGRTMLHGMVNYDGVRHFLEAFPPLAVLAGIGLAHAADLAAELGPAHQGGKRALRGAVAAVLVAGPLWAVASTHPNGIGYYNRFLGGLSGARARGIHDATDYWGNSYWQGLDWIARHAEPGAGIAVPIATHVARCAAPLRTPDGPPILRAGDPPADPVYLMYITRTPAYGPLIRAFDGELSPIHEIRVQGAPILRILRLSGEKAVRAQELLEAEADALASARNVLRWLEQHPEQAPAVMQAVIDPERVPGDALRRLEALLPAELHADARALLWSYRR